MPAIGPGTSPASVGRLDLSGHSPASLWFPRAIGRNAAMAESQNNMSAKPLAACNFELPARRKVATDPKASEGLATPIPFREGLWQEYRIEGINAGFSNAQATEYASALSPEMGAVGGVSEMAPAGRCWFYHSRVRVAKRTATSGLIRLTRWRKSRTSGRPTAAGNSVFAYDFRTWNAGGKH